MIQSRRSFLRNLFVAPAIVSATNIMPVKAMEWLVTEPTPLQIPQGHAFTQYNEQEAYQVLGYKGKSEFDAGLFYCPYVPLQTANGIYGATNAIGHVISDKYDPVYISMIRRQLPNQIAYDVIGAQPMNANTGRIFQTRYGIRAGELNVITASEGTGKSLWNENSQALDALPQLTPLKEPTR